MPRMDLSAAEKEEILRWRAKRAVWNEAIETAIKTVEENFDGGLTKIVGQLLLRKKD